MELVDKIKSSIKTRNNFSLTTEGVLTADFGDFVPILVKELVPTDSFTVQPQAFIRCAPLATPTFGKVHAYINSFFVPIRILMPRNEYEDSMTGGIDGDYPETFPFITMSAVFLVYRYTSSGFDASERRRIRKLFSYLGLGNLIGELEYSYRRLVTEGSLTEAQWLQQNDSSSRAISLLPFLALFRIFYDYYAPMNIEEDFGFRETFTHQYKGLITSSSTFAADRQRLAIAMLLLVTCYNKDYFTSAMTRPQRGAASVVDVDLNVDSSGGHAVDLVGDVVFQDAAVSADNLYPSASGQGQRLEMNDFLSGDPAYASSIVPEGETGRLVFGDVGIEGSIDPQSSRLTLRNSSGSALSQFKVQAARFAEKIQSFLETNNIAGGRFFEQMLARFGVKFPAKVLQRAEYLGGKDFWVQISDVTSTSATDSASLGQQAGKAIALGKDTISYSSEDYGFFISVLHFVPETFGLVDGIDRMWTRHSKFDYWQPELEDTGMGPVYNRELNRHHFTLFGAISDANPDGVFGYNPRYAEYKVANPILAGDFVLNPAAGLSVDTMASMNLFRRVGLDDYADDAVETPILSRDFVSILGYDAGHNNFNRIFQNTSDHFDHFFINTQIAIGANRPMIGYAEGGLEFSHENKGNRTVSMAYGGMRL